MGTNGQLPAGWGQKSSLPEGWGSPNTKPFGGNDNVPKSPWGTSPALPNKDKATIEAEVTESAQSQPWVNASAKVVSPLNETAKPLVTASSNEIVPTADEVQVQDHPSDAIQEVSIAEKDSSSSKRKVLPALIVSFIAIALIVLIVLLLPLIKKNNSSDNSATTPQDTNQIVLPSTDDQTKPVTNGTSATTENKPQSDAPVVSETVPIPTPPETTPPVTTPPATTPPETSPITTPPETEPPTPPITDPPVQTVDLSKYQGYWYAASEVGIYDDLYAESELRIGYIYGNTFYFNWGWYRMDYIGAYATLEGNVATFSYGATNGYLVFNEDTILFDFTETENEYIEDYTLEFDIHTETSMVNVTQLEPNEWCPNCGYGFFTTSIDYDGFECSYCGHNWLPGGAGAVPDDRPQSETGSLEVNDITIDYILYYSDENTLVTIDSFDAELVKSSDYSGDVYRFYVDGQITDYLNRTKYLVCFELDENDTIIERNFLTFIDGSTINETYSLYIFNPETVRLWIDVCVE